MNAIIDAAFSRKRSVIMVLLFVLVAGVVAWLSIAKEASPDVDIPIIYVTMSHDGISPADATKQLLKPMEQELRSVPGVKEMRSTAYAGGANVVLEFAVGFDADQALKDVRESVDNAASELPNETKKPKVEEVNLSLFPVLIVGLSGDMPKRTLYDAASELQDALEGIPEILEVDVGGTRDEVLEIILDPLMVGSYGISLGNTLAAVRANNRLVPAGIQDSGRGRFALKVPGLFESLQDIYDYPIAVEGDAVVRARDIADVRATFKDPQTFVRIDGKPALALEIVKRSGVNIIDTIDKVRTEVERVRATWPPALQQAVYTSFLQDNSKGIRVMLSDLTNNVISAVLLVMIVIVAILGIRAGSLVGLAIPGSFMLAILVMLLSGVTVNTVVLFALILSVGILVDGAIVVAEYAETELARGLDSRTAYTNAAKQMSWPVIVSTMTTLVAFLPLLFWPGIPGKFLLYLPVTMMFTLGASLLMALIFVPVLGSILHRSGRPQVHTTDIVYGTFTRTYRRALHTALRFPARVLVFMVVSLVGIFIIYAKYGNGIEFFPDVEPDYAVVEVRARGNLSIMEKDAIVRQVEERVLSIKEFDAVYGRTGGATRDQARDTIGNIRLTLKDWQERRTAATILDDIKQRTQDIAGIIVSTQIDKMGPGQGKDIQIELTAPTVVALPDAVSHVLRGMESVGEFTNTEDSRPLLGIDWEIVVDKARAARYGITMDAVGKAVRFLAGGVKAGDYYTDQARESMEIRLRAPRNYRTIEELSQINIATNSGNVPFSNFVTIVPRAQQSILDRRDGYYVMRIKADVKEGVLPNTKVKELNAWLADNPLPRGIGIAFRGENEDQKESSAFLSKAFVVALFLMMMILVTRFNNFYYAIVILSAVVMSTLGVFIGLLIAGQPFGIIMSGIGVIALAGIVVNNNIVLIDTFQKINKTTDSVRAAIVETGTQRLRPVLLTSLTTALGLLPMIFGVNISFIDRTVTIGAPSMQMWQQLSMVIVSGLLFATVLTLFITPCALMIQENTIGFFRRRFFTVSKEDGMVASVSG